MQQVVLPSSSGHSKSDSYNMQEVSFHCAKFALSKRFRLLYFPAKISTFICYKATLCLRFAAAVCGASS